MLSLQFASAFVSLSMDMGQFNRDFATLQAKLTRLPKTIDVMAKIDTGSATTKLDALRQKFDEFRKQAQQGVRINVQGGIPGGMGGGGGRGGGGFSGFPEPGHGGSVGMGSGKVGVYDPSQSPTIQQYARNKEAAEAAAAATIKAAAEAKAADDKKQAAAVQAGRKFRDELAAHHAKIQAETARHNQKLQAEADRAAARDAATHAKIQAEAARHNEKLKALALKMAAEDARLQKQKQSQFTMGIGMGAGMPFALTPQMAAGQALGMGIMKVGGAMKESIDIAMDLETQFATLGRVSGKSADEILAIKQGLIDLSVQKGIAVPLGELIEFATNIAKAGVSATPEILKMTETLAKLKILLPEMGAEQMSIAMVRVLKNFKLGTEHAEGFASALVKVDQESPATAQQIFNIANRLSGIAGASGASATGVLAIAGGLAGMGNNAESASTSMGQMFTQMATNLEKFAKFSGVSAEEFARAYREDPIKALQLFLTAFNKTEDTIEKAQFMEGIGIKGQRSKQTMMTFAGIIDETVAKVPRLNEEMQTGAALMASTGAEAAKTAGSFTRLSNATTAFADSIGGPFLAPLAAAAEALAVLAASFQKTGIAAATATAMIRATGIGLFVDISGRGGTAGAPTGAGAAKKLPALPQKNVFVPPGEGLPAMPSVEAAFGKKAKGGAHPEEAVPGVPMRHQFAQAIFETEQAVKERNEAAWNAQQEAKRKAEQVPFMRRQVAEREASGIKFSPEQFAQVDSQVAEAEAVATEAAAVSAKANASLIEARDMLAKLKELELRQKGKEDLMDIGKELKAGVGNLIGNRMKALGGLMQFGAGKVGDMAEWVKERNKDKPHLTIGRSVMDYAEKVTESVLNQETGEEAKATAKNTEKAAKHLDNIEKAMLKGGNALAGPALLGNP